MGHVGVEIEAVPWLQQVGLVAVAIPDLALQHEQELDPLVLEDREDVGILAESDEVRLDRQQAAEGMAEQLVLVPRTGAAALDRQALARLDVGCTAFLFEPAEEGGDRHLQRARQLGQGRERGRSLAVLDLGKHACRHVGALRQLRHGHAKLVAEGAHFAPDRGLQASRARGDMVRVLELLRGAIAALGSTGPLGGGRRRTGSFACRLADGLRFRAPRFLHCTLPGSSQHGTITRGGVVVMGLSEYWRFAYRSSWTTAPGSSTSTKAKKTMILLTLIPSSDNGRKIVSSVV